MFAFVPTPILGPAMYFVGYFAACVGIEIPGTKASPKKFGQILVSNIGVLGLEVGLAPLCPPTFAQIVSCFGKIRMKPVVDEVSRSIVAREVVTATYTLDHRFGDAALCKQVNQIIKEYIEDPDNFKPENYKDYVSKGEIE